MSLAGEKDAARQAGFARRKAAHGAGLSERLTAALEAALRPYRGRPLAGYMPIRTEADPRDVMAGWDAPVGVPVIQGPGQPLVFHIWTPDAEMSDGPFGAAKPAAARSMVPEVLIVPLVAFDRNGFRLGYGGGFYDRTLERLRARGPVVAVGFAFAAQEAESLPIEPTDQPLDLIVTEAGAQAFGVGRRGT